MSLDLLSNSSKVFRVSEFYLTYRKRQREQEIAEEEAAKKKKEWEQQWEVSVHIMVSSKVEYRLSRSEFPVGKNKLVTSNLLSVICPLTHTIL